MDSSLILTFTLTCSIGVFPHNMSITLSCPNLAAKCSTLIPSYRQKSGQVIHRFRLFSTQEAYDLAYLCSLQDVCQMNRIYMAKLGRLSKYT